MSFSTHLPTVGVISVVAVFHSVAMPATSVPGREARLGSETFRTYATSTGRVCAEANAITEIRRISGLTFEQLAKVFAVTRRTLHLWVGGQRMQPAKQERVQRTLAVLRRIDRGAPDLTLAALLRDGAKALDLLADGELSQLEELLNAGLVRRQPLSPTSEQALAERMPPSPADLVQATQDGPHPAARDGKRIKSMKATRLPRGK